MYAKAPTDRFDGQARIQSWRTGVNIICISAQIAQHFKPARRARARAPRTRELASIEAHTARCRIQPLKDGATGGRSAATLPTNKVEIGRADERD
jgi:hypothetical protein